MFTLQCLCWGLHHCPWHCKLSNTAVVCAFYSAVDHCFHFLFILFPCKLDIVGYWEIASCRCLSEKGADRQLDACRARLMSSVLKYRITSLNLCLFFSVFLREKKVVFQYGLLDLVSYNLCPRWDAVGRDGRTEHKALDWRWYTDILFVFTNDKSFFNQNDKMPWFLFLLKLWIWFPFYFTNSKVLAVGLKRNKIKHFSTVILSCQTLDKSHSQTWPLLIPATKTNLPSLPLLCCFLRL